MRGSLLIEKKLDRWNSFLKSRQFQMLLASIATGVLAGLAMTHLRLHLGLPGHRAVFWMTPVIMARLLGKCRAGSTAGALAAGVTTLGLGGNIAGGLIALPLIGVAGILLDTVISIIEKRTIPTVSAVSLIGSAAMLANLICFVKRMLAPAGLNPHHFLGISFVGFDLLSYAVFGLVAGLLAASMSYLITAKKR